MSVKSNSIKAPWIDPDDAPDLSAEPWVGHIAAHGVVTRGRPKSANPKVSQTLRLDGDVLAWYRASGEGWQSRMNDALRKAAGLSKSG